MTPLRAHDHPAVMPVPDLKVPRRIMAGLITAAALCLAMTIATIMRDARVKKAPPVPASGVSGAWKGTAALIGIGICDLRFEIKDLSAGQFEGFSSFSCTTAEPLMAKGHHPDLRAEALDLNPNAAVLTGALQNGVIQFRAVHSIGTDINACSVRVFNVAQFGSERLSVEWKDCGGGSVIMQRMK